MHKVLNNKIWVILSLMFYYSFLYVYVLFFSIQYDYYSPPRYSLARYLIGLLFSLFSAFVIKSRLASKANLTSLFFIFQILLVYIPANLFIALHNEYSFFVSGLLFCTILFIFFLTSLLTKLFNSEIKRKLSLSIRTIIYIPLVAWFLFCVCNFVFLLLKKGINLNVVFDESQIYDFRSEVFNEYSTGQFISFYTLAYFLFPLFLLYAVYYKKKYLLIFVFIANLCLYTLTGMKTYFLMPFFTLFFFWVIRKLVALQLFSMTLLSIIILCFFTSVIGIFLEANYPTALFLRSVMEPAQMHVIWIDFFYDKQKIPFWIFNPASHPNFPGLQWDEIITKKLGGSIGNGEGANTGFIANSFSVYGFSGLFVYSITLSIFFAFLNFVYEKAKNGWIAATAIPAFFLLTNISFFGVLLYFGLAMALLTSLSFGNYSFTEKNC